MAVDSHAWIPDHEPTTLDRRQFLAGTASVTVAACSSEKSDPVAEPAKAEGPVDAEEPGIVRIASVKTAVEVSVLVKPGGARRINTLGALAFQTHLLQPATQAAIRAIHYPGQDASWEPAGRHDRIGMLPKV